MSSNKRQRKSSASKISAPTFEPAITAFDAARRHYAHVSLGVDSHTLRIFDTGSEKCISRWTSQNIQERVSAIAFIELQTHSTLLNDSSKRAKKRRKSNPAEKLDIPSPALNTDAPNKPAIALGQQDGSILILDVASGQTINHLKNAANDSAISCISFPTFPANGQLLWSSSKDGLILAWNLPSSDGSGGSLLARIEATASVSAIDVRHLLTGPDDVEMVNASTARPTKALIISGLHSITVLEVDIPAPQPRVQELTPLTLATCAGHSGQITKMQWLDSSSSNPAFLSIAANDRFVNIWRTIESVPDIHLAASFSLEEDVLSVSVAQSSAFLVMATSIRGLTSITQLPPAVVATSKKAPKFVALQTLCQISATASAKLVEACMTDSESTLLATSGIRPTFHTATIKDADGSLKQSVTIQSKGKKPAVDQDGDADMEAPAQRMRPVHSAGVVQAGNTLATSMDDTQMINDLPNPGEVDVDTAEPTLSERLKALKVARGELPAETTASTSVSAFVPIPTSSLAQTLIQALHSSDTRLLESCLIHSKSKVVLSTVKRLPVHLVLPLVEALVERLGRSKRGYGTGQGGANAGRGRALVQWLRTVLVVHIAFLVTVPGLVARLAPLYRTIESRLDLHSSLLALNGRLELVVSQIELRKETLEASASQSIQMGKQVASRSYIEGEDEDSPMEEQLAKKNTNGIESANDSADEGSIEDVVLRPTRSASSDDDDDSSGDEGELPNGVGHLLDLEADEDDSMAGTDDDDDDDDDDIASDDLDEEDGESASSDASESD